MKMIKWFFVFGVFLWALAFAGCPIDRPVPTVFPIPDAPAGTWRASAEGAGFANTSDPRSAWWTYRPYTEENRGDPITVTLTVSDGFITRVDIVGDDETDTHFGLISGTAPITVGEIILNWAEEQIIRRNAIELDHVVDSTFTISGIIQAGERALQRILDDEGEEVTD